ncbi:MAG TPA: class I SAM-dependent methyltransferase [Solirubrobacteraceae bacterium]|nr:class I SAM-dependent methyltransferase [Solirubrobacteraceae bacterium]
MAAELEHVHPTRPTEKMLAALASAVMRSGADRWIRGAMLRTTRPTYTRTLRVVPSRLELPMLLNARHLLGTAVEVGVDEGVFSDYLLSWWRGSKLISVDAWLEMPADEYTDTCNTSQRSMEEKFEITSELLAPHGERSEIRRELSVDAAARFEPGSLDFVYLDARHDFEGVTEDLGAWFEKVRRGGLMAGHDYNDGVFVEGVHGVRSAVDSFFAARSIPVRHTYTDVPAASWIVEIPPR